MNLGAAAVKMVDEIVDRFLVAGDLLGREHHRIPGLDPDRLMIVQGDSVQCRKGFPLAAGGEEGGSVARELLPPLTLDHDPVGKTEVAQIRGDLSVVDHAAPAEDDPASKTLRQLNDLLEAGDVGREGGDEQSRVTLLKDLFEISPYFALGRGVALTLHVSRVGEEKQDPFLSVGGESLEIEPLVIHGCIVDLEVAGVNDCSERSLDGKGQAVHQAMSDAYPFELKRRQLPNLSGLDFS